MADGPLLAEPWAVPRRNGAPGGSLISGPGCSPELPRRGGLMTVAETLREILFFAIFFTHRLRVGRGTRPAV